MERRLAAIHAADVACYNRLMEDEAGTRAALNELRQGIFVSLVAGHCGWIVKVMRDRALVEFASVVNMVDFAVDLLKCGWQRRTMASPTTGASCCALGSTCKVVVDGGRLYADGGNIAA